MKTISNTRLLFTGIVQKPDSAIDLATAALLIAKEEYPGLDIGHYINRLDEMGRALVPRLMGVTEPEDILLEINRFLFEEYGLQGNAEDYYNPKNSFINDVLDRKLGIPITLSVVYIEIAKRLGITLQGIGFPGHFLVKYSQPGKEIYIDVFNQGALMSTDDCISLLDQMYQGQVLFQSQFLTPVTNKQFLTRILNNLKSIYMNQRDFKKALEVTERILIINPDFPQEIRDRGILRMALGEYSGALNDYRRYVQMAPSAPDIDQITMYIKEVMGQLARLN